VWFLDIFFSSVISSGPTAFVYSVIGCAPLAWRRRAPVLVFVLVWLQHATGALLIDGYRPFLGLMVALFTVASLRDLRISVPALLVAFATSAPLAVWQEWADNPEDSELRVGVFVTLLYGLICVGAWAIGRWARHSKQSIEQLEQRREQAATEAVQAERRRITGELHDIVSHSVSVMVLQAAGARRVLPSDPARVDQALAQIETVGKQAMGELRRLLGVLDASGPTSDTAAWDEGRPQPGLSDLPTLLEGMRLTGLDVALTEVGESSPLDPSVELSAYRIVQESLTNTLKHAGRNVSVIVKLQWNPDALLLEVTDNGGSYDDDDEDLSTQHGILGLRERARAVGGRLEAGPQEPGGFRVAAVLPLSGSSMAIDPNAES